MTIIIHQLIEKDRFILPCKVCTLILGGYVLHFCFCFHFMYCLVNFHKNVLPLVLTLECTKFFFTFYILCTWMLYDYKLIYVRYKKFIRAINICRKFSPRVWLQDFNKMYFLQFHFLDARGHRLVCPPFAHP